MKRKAFLLGLFMIYATYLSAQHRTITGKVVGEERSPIEYATIVLQKPDSTYVKAVMTDTLGMFSFSADDIPNYRLLVQHLMYNTLEFESSKDDLGIIELIQKDHIIDAVTVIGERPLVRVNDGVLSYNVEQITNNKVVTNAYDALLELPGVSETDGTLSLAGASNVTVILNGKPSTMTTAQLKELLKQMPVSFLETAEIMYSTPPQYHVRGAAINLIVNSADSKMEIPRLQGEVRGAFTQKKYGNYNAGIGLIHSSKRLSGDFMYSFGNSKMKPGIDLLSKHNVSGITYEIEQYNTAIFKAQTHTARLGLDYKLSENDLVSMVYTTSINAHQNSDEYSVGTFTDSHNIKQASDQLHNIAVDYISDFGLKTGANYTYYKAPSTQNFTETDSSGTLNEFFSESEQKINSLLVYVDQEHKLQNKWKLTYGAKFRYAKDRDYQKYTITQGGSSLFNTDNSIDEYIYDIYIGGGKSFSERLSMNVSLTGEYYRLVKDEEWALFPQAQLTYSHSSSNIIQFSFSSDKNYPSYWEKQDYVGYMNGYSQIHGNPLLKPFNNYSAQLSYIRNQKYIFVLYYIYQPKYAVQLAYQSPNELSLFYKTQNWDYNQMVGFNVVIPFKVGKWLDSRVTLNGFYQKSKFDDYYDIGFDNEKFIGRVQMSNTINVSSKPNIKLNVSGYYMTGPIQGIYDLSDIWSVDASAKWVFAGERAEIAARVTDIFDSSMPDIYVNSRGQNFNMYVWQETRSFILSFSYKFGDYKQKMRKDVDRTRLGH